MKAPARDPGDFCIAQCAESTLFMPEKAKSAGTPKRVQHVSPFAFFEVGFIGWIVRVSFAFYLDVSFDGSALGVVQPDFIWPSFVIAGFIEEGPIAAPTPFKVFRFDPARGLVRMPFRKVPTFFLEGLMSSFPLGYLRTFCPRKSKPRSTCVTTVFVGESSSPRSCTNCSTRGLISPSSSSFDLLVMTKSSA